MEKEKMGRDFSRERDALYDECEEFIEELLNDVGKPWYPIKSRVEWILEQIPHASDIKKLEEYDRALKEARAEVERIKDETAEDGFEYAYRSILQWLRDKERTKDAEEEEKVDEKVQFYRVLDSLYKECESFIEELMRDEGQPWYPVKDRVEWLLERIPHALEIKKLEEYELELKEARAEVERIKDETAEDGFEYAYRSFLRWLKDMEGSSESRERKIDNEMLQFYRRLDELYDECELFMEELTDDIGKPWYYSAKKDVERIFEKIPHALGIKELERYEFELEELKEKVKRRRAYGGRAV